MHTVARTRSMVLPGVGDGDDLLAITAMDDLEAHATVVAGRLPASGAGTRLEVVMHDLAAASLGLSPGQELDPVVKLDRTPVPRPARGDLPAHRPG